jgi:hypothetical protein
MGGKGAQPQSAQARSEGIGLRRLTAARWLASSWRAIGDTSGLVIDVNGPPETHSESLTAIRLWGLPSRDHRSPHSRSITPDHRSPSQVDYPDHRTTQNGSRGDLGVFKWGLSGLGA